MEFWKFQVRPGRLAKLFAVTLTLVVLGFLTYERWSRPSHLALEYQMTETQVLDIMGEPLRTHEGAGIERWDYRADGRDQGRSIQLVFRDSRLDNYSVEGYASKWNPWYD